MNIAVIGCGYWGKNIVRNYHELNSLYAVCESDPNKIEQIKTQYPNTIIYTDLEDLLNDKNVQGIAIATPAPTHFNLAKRCLEAGFPTYVEKPLTLNIEDAKELTRIAKKEKQPLMVGHIMAFNPAISKIKELIDSGKYGKVKHIKCTRVNLGKIRAQENIWWSFAPHDLSIIFFLLDQEPEKVQASTFKSIQQGVEDTVYADLTFVGGESAHIEVSWLEPIKLHQTTIICEKAMIVFNDTAKENKLVVHEYEFDKSVVELVKIAEIPVQYPEGQPLRLECQHFMDCIENNLTPLTDGESACRVINVIEQVDKSIKDQNKVKV